MLAALCGLAALTPSPPLQPSTKASVGSTTSSHLDHGHVTSPARPFLIFFALRLEGSNVPIVHEISTQLQTARGPGPPLQPQCPCSNTNVLSCIQAFAFAPVFPPGKSFSPMKTQPPGTSFMRAGPRRGALGGARTGGLVCCLHLCPHTGALHAPST